MEPDAQLAPRVLVAVADDGTRRNTAMVLRESGFSVSATTDPSAALMLAESFAPDVIIVDLMLGAERRTEVFATLRTCSDTYVVALTGGGHDATALRALHAGADS